MAKKEMSIILFSKPVNVLTVNKDIPPLTIERYIVIVVHSSSPVGVLE
jgi:hypothetical protein